MGLDPLVDWGVPFVALSQPRPLIDVDQVHDGLQCDGLRNDIIDSVHVFNGPFTGSQGDVVF
jgi:hypothetical protein